MYWNDWFHAIILINKPNLYPLQVLLRQVLSDYLFVAPPGVDKTQVSQLKPPPEGVRMATMMLTVGPIILVYPFAQRYFVRGIVIGAIKGG
jgi:ABC-type glycerol-3-phosphate transport system permease component